MRGEAVLRYRDGQTERVELQQADLGREMLHVKRSSGENANVPFATLKAVFFPHRSEEHEYPEAASTIAVEFADGEVIRGMAHYNPERNGFFLYPEDRSKNDRIFVVNSAIVSIEVEKL